MSTRRRRKCRNCGQLFRPDPRNVRHQRYCSGSACRRARASRPVSAAGCPRRQNRDYFRGPEQVERVRAWRTAHPGYARKRSRGQDALQEHSSAQPVDTKKQSDVFGAPALQRERVLETLSSSRFVDRSPGEVVATLLDEGQYLDVHYGRASQILYKRERTLRLAWNRHPERFVNGSLSLFPKMSGSTRRPRLRQHGLLSKSQPSMSQCR